MKPHDNLYPVSRIYAEIEIQLRRLGYESSFVKMKLHVEREIAGCDENRYHPSFAKTLDLPSPKDLPPSKRRAAVILVEQLNLLEKAVVICVRAKAPTPKPLFAFLQDGLNLCREVTTIQAREEARRKHRCAKGGRARHAKNDPAKRHAALLITRKAPPEGWRTATEAARAIMGELCEFIQSRGLSLSVCNLEDTIKSWIRSVTFVRAAFLLKKSARR